MKRQWWHDKVAYQIIPRALLDGNGDGIGDIQGILSKLDYLKELGIDILWLSPIYQSPFIDQGYDISDYYRIAEEFGTMEEFDLLLEETKKRGMYLVMDLVVNHCSDRHEWFQKALADPCGPLWGLLLFPERQRRKSAQQLPVLFWRKHLGTGTGTDLYYLHFFAKEQPDLNWENPKVRQEIYKMINWWLDKGVAGFRIDAIINIKKDVNFPSYEPDGADGLVHCTKMVENVEGVDEFLEEMKRETFQKHQAFTVGEVFNMKEGALEEFIGDEGHFSTMFDFSAHQIGQGKHGWYDARPVEFKEWRDTLFASQKETEGIGFKSNIIENHDEPRGASRYLPDYARNETGKKLLASTMLLLRGLPFLYQGQEIGMTNWECPDVSQYDDISTKDQYQEAIQAGCTPEQAMKACRENSRDNARTPMQWSAEEHAGFTKGTPWLTVNPNYTEINVEEQETREDSVLAFYRKLIALRKSDALRETFTYGETIPAYEDQEKVFAYFRSLNGGAKILVAGNYGTEAVTLPLPEGKGTLLLSNTEREAQLQKQLEKEGQITLQGLEGAVLLLEQG